MDIRYAWRSLSRTPGFSLLIIVTLALGIGATTTMFSAAWAVFFRPLPFPNQDRLVTITGIEFFGIWALFTRFGQIQGWTLEEVAFRTRPGGSGMRHRDA